MFNYETKCAWSDRNQGVLPNGRYPLDGAEGEWKGLKSIGIEKKTLHRGEEEERDYRYYISPENRNRAVQPSGARALGSREHSLVTGCNI